MGWRRVGSGCSSSWIISSDVANHAELVDNYSGPAFFARRRRSVAVNVSTLQ